CIAGLIYLRITCNGWAWIFCNITGLSPVVAYIKSIDVPVCDPSQVTLTAVVPDMPAKLVSKYCVQLPVPVAECIGKTSVIFRKCIGHRHAVSQTYVNRGIQHFCCLACCIQEYRQSIIGINTYIPHGEDGAHRITSHNPCFVCTA